MNNLKLISKVKIYSDDNIFFYNPPILSIRLFSELAEPIIKTKINKLGNHAIGDARKANYYYGGLEEWKNIVYPKIDKNPLIYLLFHNPIDFVLENYLHINGYKSMSDTSKGNYVPRISLADFIREPDFKSMIDNPQWNGLLHFCDVWSNSEKIEQLSLTSQRNLVLEKLEQAVFIGFIDYLSHSIDILSFIYNKPINKSINHSVIQPISVRRLIPEGELSNRNLNEIRKNLNQDFWLYETARSYFWELYRNMTLRLVDGSNPFRLKKHLRKFYRTLLTRIQIFRVDH